MKNVNMKTSDISIFISFLALLISAASVIYQIYRQQKDSKVATTTAKTALLAQAAELKRTYEDIVDSYKAISDDAEKYRYVTLMRLAPIRYEKSRNNLERIEKVYNNLLHDKAIDSVTIEEIRHDIEDILTEASEMREELRRLRGEIKQKVQ